MAFTRALVSSFCSGVCCSAGPADGAAGFPAFTLPAGQSGAFCSSRRREDKISASWL